MVDEKKEEEEVDEKKEEEEKEMRKRRNFKQSGLVSFIPAANHASCSTAACELTRILPVEGSMRPLRRQNLYLSCLR